MTFRFTVVALLFTLLTGCAKRAGRPDAPSSVESYYPLAVGNRWTYAVEFLGEKRVQEVEILRSENGYFFDNQGGALMLDAYGIRDEKRYLLRSPVIPGRSWDNVVSGSSTERYQVLQAGAPCETRAGRFADCVRVEGRNRVNPETTLVNALTFAAGVGLVRVEVTAEARGRKIPQTRLELTAYRLVKSGSLEDRTP